MEKSKHCKACDVSKSLEEFTRSKSSTNFKSAKNTHHTYCKQCNASHAREWRKTRPGYVGSGKIKAIPIEDRLLMSAIRQRLTDAKIRCKKLKKDPPVLTSEYLYELYLSQNRKCAITTEFLVVATGHPLCLSLDQIDPSKGYVVGNVQWLAWVVNRAKGDLTLDDFYDMCQISLDNRKVQRLSKSSES